MGFSASGAVSGASAGASIGGPWGALIGAAAGGLFGGAKVKSPAAVTLPPYEKVDIGAEAKRATDINLAGEGDIEKLLARSNTFQQGQANTLMEQAIPGWGKISQKFLQTADRLISNPYDVPADVEQNLARIAAERGISSGARGQFSQFSLLRDLGVNSLQYGQSNISQGQSLLQLVGSLSPRVSPLSPLSFYVTPTQTAAVAQSNSAGVSRVAEGNQMVQQGAVNAATQAGNLNRANDWNAVASFIAANGFRSFIPSTSRGGSSGVDIAPGTGGDV